jgi:glucose-6-phosphate isomerase
MPLIEFDEENSRISGERLQEINADLQGEIKKMHKALEKDYESPRCCINLPDDEENIENVKKLVEEKKSLKPEYIVVAGIGGSNLGAIAVQEAVQGKLYNQKTSNTKILFAETTDSDHVQDIIDIIEPVLENGGKVLLNGVSKSGGTTETIANFEVLSNKINEYKEEPEKFITVTSSKGSPFHRLAKQKGYSTLEIPDNVEGRYSIFSPVGLYPLGIAGLDIEELLEGARIMRQRCLNEEISENPASRSAATIFENKKRGQDIYDLFLYGKDLEMIGKWYRQLMAESLGKENNTEGEKVHDGITPLVSIGSTDLHSMVQLYLGGPRDKLHSFVWAEENRNKIELPERPEYEELVEDIQGMDMKEIMRAIFKGVNTAFEKAERPYNIVKISDKSERSIGAFLQFKMIEMIYLGSLLNVNPFNQPNVEEYKNETRKIMKG